MESHGEPAIQEDCVSEEIHEGKCTEESTEQDSTDIATKLISALIVGAIAVLLLGIIAAAGFLGFKILYPYFAPTIENFLASTTGTAVKVAIAVGIAVTILTWIGEAVKWLIVKFFTALLGLLAVALATGGIYYFLSHNGS